MKFSRETVKAHLAKELASKAAIFAPGAGSDIVVLAGEGKLTLRALASGGVTWSFSSPTCEEQGSALTEAGAVNAFFLIKQCAGAGPVGGG